MGPGLHAQRHAAPAASMQGHSALNLAHSQPMHATHLHLLLQIMASEYATRYLEQLGVSPSRFTMDLVHRHVPLTNSCIVTTFRAKGHVNDEIQVTVPPVAHQPRIPQVIGAQAILQLGLANAEAGVVSPRDEVRCSSGSGRSRMPLSWARGCCLGHYCKSTKWEGGGGSTSRSRPFKVTDMF